MPHRRLLWLVLDVPVVHSAAPPAVDVELGFGDDERDMLLRRGTGAAEPCLLMRVVCLSQLDISFGSARFFRLRVSAGIALLGRAIGSDKGSVVLAHVEIGSEEALDDNAGVWDGVWRMGTSTVSASILLIKSRSSVL